MTVFVAPAAGWTAADLPTEIGTVIQYVNVQGSRVITALDDDAKTWKALRINSLKHSRLLEMTTSHLLNDLEGALFLEVLHP